MICYGKTKQLRDRVTDRPSVISKITTINALTTNVVFQGWEVYWQGAHHISKTSYFKNIILITGRAQVLDMMQRKRNGPHASGAG